MYMCDMHVYVYMSFACIHHILLCVMLCVGGLYTLYYVCIPVYLLQFDLDND